MDSDWQQVTSTAGTYWWNSKTNQTTQVGAPRPGSSVEISELEAPKASVKSVASVESKTPLARDTPATTFVSVETKSVDASKPEKVVEKNAVPVKPVVAAQTPPPASVASVKAAPADSAKAAPVASAKAAPAAAASTKAASSQEGMYIVVFKNGASKDVVDAAAKQLVAQGTLSLLKKEAGLTNRWKDSSHVRHSLHGIRLHSLGQGASTHASAPTTRLH